jgi:hypothetical protein
MFVRRRDGCALPVALPWRTTNWWSQEREAVSIRNSQQDPGDQAACRIRFMTIDPMAGGARLPISDTGPEFMGEIGD